MFVITNIAQVPLTIDGVSIDPGEQLSVVNLSPGMVAARNAGALRVLSGDTTLAERKADTAALKPFKTGDLAIDGEE
jgi:hypothetical protein